MTSITLQKFLNIYDDDGSSLLHHACSNDNESAIEFLLDLGADPFDKNNYHQTCFDIAYKNNSCAAIHLLNNYIMHQRNKEENEAKDKEKGKKKDKDEIYL